MVEQQICTRIINENIQKVKLGEALTMPLKELNYDCRFKDFYNEFCNIQEGLEPDTDIRKIEIAKRHKAYREKNKDKIAKIGKAYYEKNKDKIAKQKKAYYEKNKDKLKAYREKNKDKIAKQKKAYYEKNKEKQKIEGKK